MRLLIITAVEREARAIGSVENGLVVVAGVGRTNGAAATTEALLRDGPFDAVLNAGVAGALPGSGLSIGDVVVATHSVYVEEGLIEPGGFRDMTGLGFPLGDFEGNAVPGGLELLAAMGGVFERGRVATVATCSGTDSAARMVAERTGAVAEAMEGAAVIHAGRRMGVPGLELRVISNTTGDRGNQQWDLERAMGVLGESVAVAILRLGAALPGECPDNRPELRD